jgi:hypothetical protein
MHYVTAEVESDLNGGPEGTSRGNKVKLYVRTYISTSHVDIHVRTYIGHAIIY